KPIDVSVSPVFKYRGIFPWDNFLDGMSGYNFEHYQELIDRAARMKFNMLQFHFYSGIAFYTEVWDGKPLNPSFIGSPVDVFHTKGAIGEKAFNGIDIFGPKPYVDNIGNPRAQAEECQEMLRKVIDYAHSRGFKTVVGFELMVPVGGEPTWTDKPSDGNGGANYVNPLDPHNVDLSLQRYRTLVQTYPNSDYYWIWQSEGRGFLSRNVGGEFYKSYLARLYGGPARGLLKICEAYDQFEPYTPGACPGDARNMLLGAGWTALVLPTLPNRLEDLEKEQWRTVVAQASGDMCGISGQKKLLEMDRNAISSIRSVLPKLDEQGRSWAGLMLNRLEFRCLFLKSMMALNESFITYDKVARKNGLDEGRKASLKDIKVSIDYARQAINKYAEDVRNRGDQGVIAQLNEQCYGVLKKFYSDQAAVESSHASIDWAAFRLTPGVQYDFSGDPPWSRGSGKVEMSRVEASGRPALRLEIAGDPGSVILHPDVIDLEEFPILDFRIRTQAKRPLAMLFQTNSGTEWKALALIGPWDGCPSVGRLPDGAVNDGEWRRVTCDLLNVFKERIGAENCRIRQIVLACGGGEPAVVEFQSFSFGKRNTLD
ncbi:MAG: hypothetical protein HYX78_16005, partial [Armatimonadetes bacterium]|nr:hypothetical protein [Armatimonadota bacterium]